MAITGSSENDLLVGTSGDDALDGGPGDDTLVGGTGDDTYLVDSPLDVITEDPDEGTDSVVSTVSYALPDNVENLTVLAASVVPGYPGYTMQTDTVLTGNDLDNVLEGQAAKETGLTSVPMPLGSGVGSYTFMDGHALYGGGGNDRLIAGGGNDLLDGGTGADTMSGGAGADTYIVDDLGDQIIGEAPPVDWAALGLYSSSSYTFSDVDLVKASVDFTLADNLENLTLTGQARQGTGNGMANVVQGNGLDNVLLGLGGMDTLQGGAGNDTLIGGAGDDELSGDGGADVYQFSTGDGHDRVHADAQDSIVLATGLRQADLRVSYASNGSNSLVLQVDAGGDTITLDQADLWRDGLTLSWVDGGALTGQDLLDMAQPLPVVGTPGDDLLTGAAANDTLQGLAGNDTLDGGLGEDLMVGGQGDDVYKVGQVGDQVGELPGEGTDTVISAVDWTLGANTENLTLTAVGLRGTGNDGANVLRATGVDNDLSSGDRLEGLGGDDTLVAAGNDTLVGGTGDDVYDLQGRLLLYYPDPANAGYPTSVMPGVVVEQAGEGTDEVRLHGAYGGAWFSGSGYALADNVENLTLVKDDGAFPYVSGNALANVITGNDQANAMAGGGGDDTLLGGAGADDLRGGLGNDVLDGGAGADTFRFARGDDQDLVHADATDALYFDAGITAADLVFDASAEASADTLTIGIKGGTDSIALDHVSELDALTIRFADGSSGSLAQLRQFVPKPDPVHLVGGWGRDTLTGGGGDDTLDGQWGSDVLAGGLGDDTLIGGYGNDTYLFKRGDGHDTIIDHDGIWFNADQLKVGDVRSDQLWFSRSGDNLDISVIGSTDQVTVQDWFKSWTDRVETITALGDGKSLSASKVANLVNAMASFSPPAMGQTSLPADTAASLAPVIASNWA